MGRSVRQSDIADKLNLSRNTISKVFNNDPRVSEKTRELVIKTAIDMGYTRFNVQNIIKEDQKKNICIVTHSFDISNSFWALYVKGIEEVARSAGYNVMIHTVNLRRSKTDLPCEDLVTNQLAGIIIIGGSFGKEYYYKISATGIPAVFVDTAVDIGFTNLLADIIMIDNEDSVFALTTHLIELGHKNIGFIGNIGSCKSFRERWKGYNNAMKTAGLKVDENLCVINRLPTHFFSYSELEECINMMKKHPSAMVCANDTIAMNLIKILKEQGLSLPGDMSVTGFDDKEGAAFISPSLTTVHYYRVDMGRRTAEELIWRINNPDRPYEIVRVSTKVVIRESTSKYESNKNNRK